MDNGLEEPLNLTIRKKPIAIVAPSAITMDANQNVKAINHNINKIINDSVKFYDDAPEDLSIRKHEETETNFLYEKNTNLNLHNECNNNNNNEDLQKYLLKNLQEAGRNSYNKNSFEETVKEYDLKSNIFKDVYKISDFYETLANRNLTTPENIYSVINHLAEHKFLTAWYMNSVLSMPYMGLSPKGFAPNQPVNSPTKNSILNNLLDKKPSPDFKPALNFDTIIKNEMRNDNKQADYFHKCNPQPKQAR